MLDGLNTRVADQLAARREVLKFLKVLRPQDRVAVYGLGRKLRVLHDFTTDPEELQRAISGAGVEGTLNSEMEHWLADADAQSAALVAGERVRLTTRALEAIANHVAYLPHRKNLVWISAGFPYTLGVENYRMTMVTGPRGAPGAVPVDFSVYVDRAARALNRANIAVYPVLATGIPSLARYDSQRATLGPLKAPDSLESMRDMAEGTGGKAFLNTNDISGAIRSALDDTGSTYVLGFSVDEQNLDDKYHTIKVEVARKGVEVRARKGYWASADFKRSLQQRQTELEDSLWSPLEALSISLAVRVETAGDLLNLVIAVDAKDLLLREQKERWQGGIAVLVAQTAATGEVLNTYGDNVDIDIPAESYKMIQENGFAFGVPVPRVEKSSQLRIAVVDRLTGNLGSVLVPLAKLP